jgi:hypothetical protein
MVLGAASHQPSAGVYHEHDVLLLVPLHQSLLRAFLL